MIRKVVTLKFTNNPERMTTDRTEAGMVAARDERDFAQKIARIMAERGAFGFSTESTISLAARR